jgi:hypothetical protein
MFFTFPVFLLFSAIFPVWRVEKALHPTYPSILLTELGITQVYLFFHMLFFLHFQ